MDLNSRLSEHIEHRDAFWRLGRVQMIQSGNCADDSEHDGCFHPVIHQVKVRQTHWKGWEQISSAFLLHKEQRTRGGTCSFVGNNPV